MQSIDDLDWQAITSELDLEGAVRLPKLLAPDACARLAAGAAGPLSPPLTAPLWAPPPAPLDAIRAALYARLVPLARRWGAALRVPGPLPADYPAFVRTCRATGQLHELSARTRLASDQGIALHRHDEDGEAGRIIFPFEATILLSAPGRDFAGGEFGLTEQRPRMQSRPIVVPLLQGDAAIFATSDRPHRGTSGVYRVRLKHAVSRVRRGERIAIDLVFHPGARAPARPR